MDDDCVSEQAPFSSSSSSSGSSTKKKKKKGTIKLFPFALPSPLPRPLPRTPRTPTTKTPPPPKTNGKSTKATTTPSPQRNSHSSNSNVGPTRPHSMSQARLSLSDSFSKLFSPTSKGETDRIFFFWKKNKSLACCFHHFLKSLLFDNDVSNPAVVISYRWIRSVHHDFCLWKFCICTMTIEKKIDFVRKD